MLFAGLGSVRIVKNCDRGRENAALGRQHFHARGHSFSPFGPTLSRQITYIKQLLDEVEHDIMNY